MACDRDRRSVLEVCRRQRVVDRIRKSVGDHVVRSARRCQEAGEGHRLEVDQLHLGQGRNLGQGGDPLLADVTASGVTLPSLICGRIDRHLVEGERPSRRRPGRRARGVALVVHDPPGLAGLGFIIFSAAEVVGRPCPGRGHRAGRRSRLSIHQVESVPDAELAADRRAIGVIETVLIGSKSSSSRRRPAGSSSSAREQQRTVAAMNRV